MSYNTSRNLTSSRNSKTNRVNAYKGASLLEIREMRAKVSKFADNLGFVDVVEPRELTKGELEDLLVELETLTVAAEIAEARKLRIKEMIFNDLDVKGQETGELVVKDKVFKRFGGGTKEPTFDIDLLRQRILGDPDVFIDKEIVETVNQEALQEYLKMHPEEMEAVRESLIPGAKNSFRFTVSDVEDETW